MIRLRKHIAFLLFGIFFFPIIFQSIHIVWHHSHDYTNEQHLCLIETNDKDNFNKIENISQKEEICPICEYQFSLNNLPKISIFRTIIPKFTCSYIEIASQKQYKQVFRDKSSRAPPILIS